MPVTEAQLAGVRAYNLEQTPTTLTLNRTPLLTLNRFAVLPCLVVSQGMPVTEAQLAGVRSSLGITQETADTLHGDVYTELAASLIKPEAGADAVLSPEAQSKLDSTAALLQVINE